MRLDVRGMRDTETRGLETRGSKHQHLPNRTHPQRLAPQRRQLLAGKRGVCHGHESTAQGRAWRGPGRPPECWRCWRCRCGSAGMMIRLGHLAAQTAASLLVVEELPEDRGRRIGGRGGLARALLLLLAALLLLPLLLLRLLSAGGLGSGLGSGFGSCHGLGSLGSVAPGCVSSIPVSNKKSTREVLQGDANFGVEVDAGEILAPRVVGVVAAEDGDVDEEML